MDAASQEITLSVTEEEAVTPSFVVRIGLFTAVCFAIMAGLGEEEFRPFTLGLGGIFVAAAALSLIHLLRQRRYGTATLRAISPLENGHPLEGWIDTEVRTLPTAPVRVRIYVSALRSKTVVARARIDPSKLRMTAAGTLQIPFFISLPNGTWSRSAFELRLRARTASWPYGWGGTFLINSG